MHRLRILLAAALFVSVLAPAAAPAREAEAEAEAAAAGSANMTAVTTLKHRKAALSGAEVGGGSDIEFVDLDVTGLAGAESAGVTGVREFALAGTLGNGLQIVDITDPTTPVTAAVYDCQLSQGDVQVFQREGRTLVAYTHDDPYGAKIASTCYAEARELGLYKAGVNPSGTFIADITDPYQPRTVSFISEARGSHNQTVAPGGMYLYNSNSDVAPVKQPNIEVFDIRDLAAPKKVFTLPTLIGAGEPGAALDSHDITFNTAGTRAYSAAITQTLIIDTTNQAAPKIIGRINDQSVNISHQSDPVTLTDKTTGQKRSFLVVTDELAGAAGNAVCPGGGLHVYDITGPLELAPVKVGFWHMPQVSKTPSALGVCTSHVMRMHPDEQILTIAWYQAGVRVVDISGLIGVSVGAVPANGNVGVGMKEIGYYTHDNANTWSAKTNKIAEDGSFYLFGNDMARGLDVYRFAGRSAAQPSDPGTWLSPVQAAQQAKLRKLKADTVRGPYCLLLANQ